MARADPTRDSKACSVCGETKLLTEFGRSERGAGGRRSQCKTCNAASVKAKYVPRVHPPEQVTCAQCGQEFTRIRKQGALQIYCSHKCTMAAAEERKRQRNAGLGPRRCACGAEVTTRVGKPVCPDCRKDPRPDAQIREPAGRCGHTGSPSKSGTASSTSRAMPAPSARALSQAAGANAGTSTMTM
jgi:predicted nucleic acid-binding Zn ribbon protein